jgi:hypothetical protein
VKIYPRRTHASTGSTYRPTRPTRRCMRSWRRPSKRRAALPSSDLYFLFLLSPLKIFPFFFRVGFKYEEEEISFVYSSLFTPTFFPVLFGKIPSIHKNEKS